MGLFEYYTACVGFTMVAAYSDIASKVKKAMHIDHLDFFSCPQCIGFWTGVAAGLESGRSIKGTIVSGFAASVLSLATASVISWLNKSE